MSISAVRLIKPALFFIFLFVILAALFGASHFYGADWPVFEKAIHAIFSGLSPYHDSYFLSPPWTLIPLLPFAILPEPYSSAAWCTVSVAIYIYILQRLKAGKLATAAFLLSPPALIGLFQGNVDVLVLLGFFLPPWLGILFVTIKPQLGLVMVLYWLVSTWKTEGMRKVLLTFLPLAFCTIVSILLFGFWLQNRIDVVHASWNRSIFPYGIPIGILLVYFALRENKDRYAMAASIFFSPYYFYQAWIVGLLPLIENEIATILIVAGMWVALIISRWGS